MLLPSTTALPCNMQPHLELDVPWVLHVALQIHLAVAERRLRLLYGVTTPGTPLRNKSQRSDIWGPAWVAGGGRIKPALHCHARYVVSFACTASEPAGKGSRRGPGSSVPTSMRTHGQSLH